MVRIREVEGRGERGKKRRDGGVRERERERERDKEGEMLELLAVG